MTPSTPSSVLCHRFALFVTLLVVVSSTAPATQAGIGPGSTLLRLKPHSRPLLYSSRETTVQVELPQTGEPIVHRYDFDKTLRRTSTGDRDLFLKIRVEVVALKALMDTRPFAAPAGPPAETRVSSRGPLVGADGREAVLPLGLVLPADPLPPPMVVLGAKSLGGVEWTAQSEPTPDLPIAVKTRYRVSGVSVVGGHECVLIQSSAQAQGPAHGGRLYLDVWGRGQIAFDPDQGIPIETTSTLRVGQSFRAPGPKDPLRIHTEAHTTVRIRP